MRVYDTHDNWDHRFLDLAKVIGSWSKDPSTQVGAVVADILHRVRSHGYNGFARGVDDTILTREQKLARTIHAERNALHFATFDITGCTIYVTHPPCSNCAADIIQRGLTRVVFDEPSDDFLSRWQTSYEEAIKQLYEAQVHIQQRRM